MLAITRSRQDASNGITRRGALCAGMAAILPLPRRALGAARPTTGKPDDGACAVVDITWTLGPDFPEYRKGGALGTLHDMVIAAAGMQHPWRESPTTYAYKPGAEHWERLPDMPEGRVYLDGVTVGDAFYAIGGRHKGTRREVFRLRRRGGTWAWDRMPSMRQDRGWFAVDRLGAKIIVAGGNRFAPGEAAFTPKSTLASAEWFDTTKPDVGWQALPAFPGQSRGWVAGATAGGKFCIFGGSHHLLKDGKRNSPRLPDAAAFDPSAGKWSRLPNLPYPVSGMDAVAYADRYIILLGGAAFLSAEQKKRWPQDPNHYSNVVLVFDTKTGTYHPMPSPMPYGTNDIRVTRIGDTIYAVGGENIHKPTSNTTKWLRIGKIQTRAGQTEPRVR